MDECDLDSPTVCEDESSEDEESGSSDATESFDSTTDDGSESEDEESEDGSSDQTYYTIETDGTESEDEESDDESSDESEDGESESNSDTGSTSGGTAPIEESGSELEDEEEGSCLGACCHGGTFVEECVGQPCDVPIDYDYESKAAPVDPKSPYYSEIQK